ncbi:DegQ family serine endoprotease [Pelomicrobium sp. G1]|uniref:DegQ family serine endoprotease n=1 Tax=unclassified Pelomicrobium TaxID=2815318 RepID=UPI003F758017
MKRQAWILAWTALAAVLWLPPTVSGALPPGRAGEIPTLAPMLAEVTPGVVNIAVISRAQDYDNPLLRDPFFRRFFNIPDPRPTISAGSGVIVDAAQGYVLTNHHVIQKADQVVVTTRDRRRFNARLVGSDPGTDIALLKIDADNLKAIPFGDSDALRVGDFVVAIGNPFGLGQTATSGIVSALGRSGINVEGYEDFIQTDASINPGNSGGALVNLRGELVGINTAIIAPSGGNVGIGFAVPSNMARRVMDQLIRFGEVRRGWLGVTVQDLTPDLAKALGVPLAEGAVVVEVAEGSPAQKAGLKPRDIITSINGRAMRTSSEVRNELGLTPVGERVEIRVLREGRPLTLAGRIGEVGGPGSGGVAVPQLAGARLADVERGGRPQGVGVVSVERDSEAWRLGLRRGDVIIAVNQRRVASVAELREALKDADRTLALTIVRGDAVLNLIARR